MTGKFVKLRNDYVINHIFILCRYVEIECGISNALFSFSKLMQLVTTKQFEKDDYQIYLKHRKMRGPKYILKWNFSNYW